MQKTLHELNFEFSEIVSGGAIGADQLGIQFAKLNKIPCKIFKPDYKRFGRSAPIIRNFDIVVNSDFVLAFWDGKSKGTINAIQRAKIFRKNYKVILF